MKKILIFSIVLLFVTLLPISCERDSGISGVTVDDIVDAEQILMRGLGSFTIDNVDSYIGIDVSGLNIDGDCSMGRFAYLASFNDGQDVPGNVVVEGLPLDRFEEEGKWRYLLDPSIAYYKNLLPPNFDPDEIARSGEVEISFESEMPDKYASFSETFTFPHPLCLDISSFHGDEQRISEDLTFTWEPDPRCDIVYVALCVPGKPCIFKQFDDAAGSGVIPASEFADFPLGEQAWFAIGRGMGSVVEQSDGRKTGILRYTYILAIATLVP